MEPVTAGVIVALVGLVVVISVHITMIARWSGKIDTYITSNDARIMRVEGEIVRLRDARHKADGTIQRHEGVLREILQLRGRRSDDAETEMT